jgi:hypothetical protein
LSGGFFLLLLWKKKGTRAPTTKSPGYISGRSSRGCGASSSRSTRTTGRCERFPPCAQTAHLSLS